MRRGFAVLLLVTLVAIGIGTGVRRWLERPLATPSRDREPATARSDPGPSSSARVADEASAERTVDPVAAEHSNEISESGVAIEPAPASGLALRVVDGATGVAQPFAVVTRIDPYWSFEPEGAPVDFERRLDLMGRRFRADEQGRVRVPSSRGALDLFAKTHDKVGYARIEPEERDLLEAADATPKTIAVGAGRTLRVQVVDAAGTPQAGVPIAIELGPAGSLVHSDGFESRAPDGMVELRGADLCFDPARSPPSLEVRLDLPFRNRASTMVTPADLDGPPIRLTLPPTGSVEATIVDASGHVLPVSERRSIGVELPRHQDDVASEAPDPELGDVEVEFTDGRARIERVELGLLLRGRFWADECGIAEGVALGPTRPGETTSLTLVGGEPLRVLTGIVVDERGEPLAHQRLGAHVVLRSPTFTSAASPQSTTDAAGAFRFVLNQTSSPPIAFDGGHIDLWIQERDRGSTWSAEQTVGREVAQHGGSLGTIVLRPSSLIASGIVVDQDGVPVERVLVKLAYSAAWAAQNRAKRFREWWPDSLNRFWMRSDADGRFELRGDPGAGEFEVVAHSNQLLPGPAVPIELGATGVRLEVKEFSSLVAHVVLDPEIPPGVVDATVELASGDSVTETHAYPDARGDLVWRKLGAGTTTVSIRARDCFRRPRGPLFRAADVPLEPGRCTRDPRLTSIDLRGRFAKTRLEIVDGDGDPVPRGALIELVGDEPGGQVLWFEGGVIEAITAGDWPEVEITAPGFRTSRVALQAPTTRIVLGDGLPLNVEFTDLPIVLPPDRELWLTVSRIFDDETLEEQSICCTGAPLRFRLAEPGRRRISLLIQRSDVERSGVSVELPTLMQEIDVVESAADGSVPTVRVSLTADVIAAAERELSGS